MGSQHNINISSDNKLAGTTSQMSMSLVALLAIVTMTPFHSFLPSFLQLYQDCTIIC
eukprot:m.5467 g.5467  ORF g.5467 m.5467 type:complete len:57 (+) comp5001_c0_seq1:81-251(+)